jgi:hypothetical protein
MKRIILYLLLITATSGLFAQKGGSRPWLKDSPLPQHEKADTSKIKKPKIIRQWTLSSDYTTEIPLTLDTLFSEFNHYRKTDKASDFNFYPGNYGQPVYQLNFFDRDWSPDQYLYSYYKPYMFTPSNLLFFNTQVPFTELVFNFGGQKAYAEQSFSLKHSQNVNRRLNIGFQYDIIYSLGQYSYQRTKDKTFLFHTSYNGDKYTLYFNAGVNNFRIYENGGIKAGTDLAEYTPANLPVNLGYSDKAQSVLKNRNILLIQRYSPGVALDTSSTNVFKSNPVTFSLISCYEWNKKRYYDSKSNSGFYDSIYFNDTQTADSVFQSMLSNTVRIDVSTKNTAKFRIGAGVGLRSEIRSYGVSLQSDDVTMNSSPISLLKSLDFTPGKTTTIAHSFAETRNSLALTGKVFNDIGEKFGWVASGDLWIQGYRAGDFVANGRIFKDFTTRKGNITWDATGGIASYTPSYWYSSWISNNFKWDFNASREIRLNVGSSIDYPGRKLNLRFNYAIIDNYIYFGSDAMPAQHSGALSVISLRLRKEFVVWKLHWDNTLLFQQSSNSDVLSLPLAAARTSFFFDHVFRFPATKGELSVQAGGELFYYTPYNAYAYMPATGRYYNQTATETGNYPYVSAFLNLKLKRTRFFIMLDHLNSGLSGYDYYLIPGYPMNVRTLRYGLAWTFYN